jgi:hypothetical protein
MKRLKSIYCSLSESQISDLKSFTSRIRDFAIKNKHGKRMAMLAQLTGSRMDSLECVLIPADLALKIQKIFVEYVK